MNETFEIPVIYKQQSLLFPAQLSIMGYTHRFLVDVYGQEFIFELDDQGEYRALLQQANMEQFRHTEIELLKAIAQSIEAIVT